MGDTKWFAVVIVAIVVVAAVLLFVPRDQVESPAITPGWEDEEIPVPPMNVSEDVKEAKSRADAVGKEEQDIAARMWG